ncbi:MAG: hypothetical protein ACFFCW_21180 [Candidatus Hodarchaeota archaeon]
MGKLPYAYASKNRRKWIAIFQEIYGYPYCEICGKALLWYSPENVKKSVHWDHRKGESYSRSPYRWISEHPPTLENVKKFLELDLGILCKQCNFYLGKDPNRRWGKALRMNLYLKGKTPHEMAKLEKKERLSTNSILAFLNSRCTRTDYLGERWLYRDFYKEYQNFCADEGLIRVAEKRVIPQLKDMGVTVRMGPTHLTCVFGWRLERPPETAERKEISRLSDLPLIERKRPTPKRLRHEEVLARPPIRDLEEGKALIEDSFEIGPDSKKRYTHPDYPKPRKE